MGLDTVELVMEVEDHFGISIPDAEAERIRTIGDLHAFVAGRLSLNARPPATCPTQAAFYALRRHAAKQWPAFDRNTFRPATPVTAVLPAVDRIAAWEAIAESFGTRPPRLRHRRFVRWMLGGLLVMVLLTPAIAVAAHIASDLIWNRELPVLATAMLTLLVLSVTAVAGYGMALPYRDDPPEDCTTIGGLARALRWPWAIDPERDPASAEVYDDLVRIVCEQAGVEPTRVRPDTRFIDDLGLD